MKISIDTRLSLAAVVLVLSTAVAPVATAGKGPQRIPLLGHPATAFQKPARAGQDALRTPDDPRRLLRGKLDDVMAVIGKAARIEQPAVEGQPIAFGPDLDKLTREDLDSAAQRAEIQSGEVEPGEPISWMAYRKGGQPELLYNAEGLVWGGKQPFATYWFTFDSRDSDWIYHWTLTAPRPCGNFWIKVVKERIIPPPELDLSASAGCVSLPATATLKLRNLRPGDQVRLSADGKTVETFAADADGTVTKSVTGLGVGTHTIAANVSRREPAASVDRSVEVKVKPCPPTCSIAPLPAEIRKGKPLVLDASGSRVHPDLASTVTLRSVTVKVTRDGADAGSLDLPAPGFKAEYKPTQVGYYSFRVQVTDSVGQVSENECAAGPVKVTAFPLFVAGYFGKERLVREEFGGGRCAPLLGAKFGVLPEIGEHTEFEGAIGGKLNLRDSGNSSLFLDAAVNRLLSRGFIGAGVSLWDLTQSDTRALATLVHGGIELDKRGRFLFEVEGRIPFDQFDDIDNNYQFWGGIRFRPQRLK